MHIAAQQGHYLIVKYLIELGCNTTYTNAEGLTPRELLRKGWYQDPAKVE
jgi:ankyrin repeat protein